MNLVKYPLLTFAFLACLYHGSSAQDSGLKSRLENLSRKSLRAIDFNPDSISIYASTGLALAKEAGDLIMIADFKKYLGIAAWIRGNGEAAVDLFASAIEDNKILARPSEQAVCMTDLAMVYSKIGDYVKAISLHLEALTIAESGGFREVTAAIHNNLGVAYKENNRLDESYGEYIKAIAIYRDLDQRERLAGCLVNVGNIQFLKREYVSSLQYYRDALKIFEENQLRRGQASACNNMADVLKELGNIYESQQYREKALSISRNFGFVSSEVIALSGFGELLMLQGKYRESLEYFKEGIQKARRSGNASELLRLLHGASNSYDRINEFGLALQYFKEYDFIKDSLFTQETQTYLANMKIVSELSKKEAEITGLKKDGRIARLGRNMTLVVSSALMVVFGLVIFGLREKRKNDRIRMEKQAVIFEAEQDKIQSELRTQKEKEEELTRELDFRSRALTTYTLNLVQKNGMMEEIKSGIQEILKNGTTHEHELKKLIRLVDYSYSLDKDWDGFKTYFEQVHPEFFKKIKDDYPQISTTELRLCALIRLSLSIKEAATILNIAPDSVKVARHRIRKKLNLASDASITDFIMSI